jgi:hypothetical protein
MGDPAKPDTRRDTSARLTRIQDRLVSSRVRPLKSKIALRKSAVMIARLLGHG